MASLTQLRFRRGQCKATLTRVLNYFNNINQNMLDEGTITQLQLRLNRLEPNFSEFSQIQSEIEYHLETSDGTLEDKQNEIQEHENFENIYFDLVAKITAVITKFRMKTQIPSSSIIPDNSQNSPPQAIMKTNLPTLKLPSFSGVIEKWLEFRDIFNSLVKNNSQLDKIQKFYYLRSCLEGEAAQLIESIPVTCDNYDVAWTSLTDRYENKRLIVFSYVKALFEIPAISRENCSDLRHLYDAFTKNIRSLENLGQPVSEWNTLLVYLIVSKLDTRTRRDWEAYKIQGELPTMQELSFFLKEKCELLENLNVSKSDNKSENFKFQIKGKYNKNQNTYSLVSSQDKRFSCYFCKNNHSVFKCDRFLELSVSDRETEVQKLKLCINCLNPNHAVKDCNKSSCRKCDKKHNTLLHSESPGAATVHAHHTRQESDVHGETEVCDVAKIGTYYDENISANSATAGGVRKSLVLLSTAMINIQNKDKIVSARILLDPASQNNFITEQLANSLDLNKIPIKCSISGVGNNCSFSQFKVYLKIISKCSDYSKEISCLVLPKITQSIPAYSFDANCLNIPRGLVLADSSFNKSSDIDILCGVGLFYDLLLMDQLKLDNGLIVQNTRLGWILGGEINYFNLNKTHHITSLHCIDNSDTEVNEINDNLLKFWQVEECLNHERKADFCERHFIDNFYRGTDGRFVVKIPFRQDVIDIGKSKETALQRFSYLEKRLAKNDILKRQYVQFMADYERLGHMKELPIDINDLEDDGSVYYVPHHAVLKDTSSTTPCRVVFDFSAKTDKNVSLNEVQYSGPVIQSDLFDILLRFRLYYFIISADITKMYRQVWLNPEHTRFQRIFWRSSEADNIKCYELLTVTYGMAASSYLATRPIIQLAEENKNKNSRASQSLQDSFYVDDYLDGENEEGDLIDLQLNVTKILQDAGFQLRKWLTNKPQLFENFNIDKNIESSILVLGENQNNKTLGIFWNSNSDTIEFNVKSFDNQTKITKRSILSIVGQIFDPMGLVSPVIIRAKILLQLLWKEKIQWDEPVSDNLRQKWLSFVTDLKLLGSIRIPRLVLVIKADFYEMHTFVDASEKAYGACVYLRSTFNNGYSCNLVCAKSKVAPIKQLTLPRLELCAAFLGARLASRVKIALKLEFKKIYYWTDSLVTYHWINGSPDRWKTFIANRVSSIQNLSDIDDWHHVTSGDNPADIISRGTQVADIIKNDFWFQGPSWLKLEFSEWPIVKRVPLLDSIPEERLLAHVTVSKNDINIFEKYSNLDKLKRIMAYCLRFLSNLKNPKNKKVGTLSMEEKNNSFDVLIKISQEQAFKQEIRDLKVQGFVANSSSILRLRPFLDSKSIIRVGGRISKAQLPYDKRHPIILNKKHPLANLIMTNEHEKLLHCGPQQLLYAVREVFWPLSGRDTARKIVHNCVVCFKARPKACESIMGDLPAERLNQCFPFTNIGCDYAGPFYLKDRKTRKPILSKAWVCIFICMTTKSIHIELVTDLSTKAFIACFKRFIARRGKPSIVFSDNGTQFVGANSELLNFIKNNKETISNYFIDEGITWKFIPPRSPNFGGIWESGVKCIKYHLKRVLGNNHLHFDEFCTLLCQIEAILNSRPLSPLSSSPDDYFPLTPAHFLVGRSLTSLPEPNYILLPENRLNLYEKLQKMVQLFWQRWTMEYIGELQARQKWSKNYEQLLHVGSLVIVKDDNTPPLQWKMARVVKLHPGDDNVIRVVSIRFSDGSVVKRPVRKLCLLPLQEPSQA